MIGPFSGIVDNADIVRPGKYPGAFRDIAGLEMEEFWPLQEGEEVKVAFSDGLTCSAHSWTEPLQLLTAHGVASYASGELEGVCAISRNSYGRGQVWYIGSVLDPRGNDHVLGEVAKAAGIQPVIKGVPSFVEATVRNGTQGEFLFLLNHSDRSISVGAGDWEHDLMGGQLDDGHIMLAPRGAAVLYRRRHSSCD